MSYDDPKFEPALDPMHGANLPSRGGPVKISGKAVAGGGNKECLFTPGDVQFAATGEIHWLRNPFDDPLEFIWVYTGTAMPNESGYSTPDLFNEAYTSVKKGEIPE